jgi:hypothetical protein
MREKQAFKYHKDEWVGPTTFKGELLYSIAEENVDFDRLIVTLVNPEKEVLYYRILHPFVITVSIIDKTKGKQ